MEALVTEYKTYTDADSSVKPLTKENEDLANYLCRLSEGDLSRTNIKITHPIELRVVEHDGVVSYFLRDCVFSVGTEDDGSLGTPYTTISDLVTGVRARMEHQARHFGDEGGYHATYHYTGHLIESDQKVIYALTSVPVFYTVEERIEFDKENAKIALGEALEAAIDTGYMDPRGEDMLKLQESIASLPTKSISRGLSTEERQSFEILYRRRIEQLESHPL